MNGPNRRTVIRGLLAGVLTGVAMPRGAYTATRRATAFGTIVSLTATGSGAQRVETAIDAGFAEIHAIEKSMSLFDPASEVSLLNRQGMLHRPSAMLREVVTLSYSAWQATRGAFDPTVQPLWNVWAAAAAAERLPGGHDVLTARNLVGLDGVSVSTGLIKLGRPGQMLTLNGIAQGYAADRVQAAMIRHGVFSAFIDTGEIGVTAAEAVRQPAIGIADPRRPEAIIGNVIMGRGFIATSGDYNTAFTGDFSANHIFDPATGHSPAELASATVIARSGAMADALATAFLVLGRDRSLRLVQSLAGVDALLIGKDGDIAMTAGMAGKFHSA